LLFDLNVRFHSSGLCALAHFVSHSLSRFISRVATRGKLSANRNKKGKVRFRDLSIDFGYCGHWLFSLSLCCCGPWLFSLSLCIVALKFVLLLWWCARGSAAAGLGWVSPVLRLGRVPVLVSLIWSASWTSHLFRHEKLEFVRHLVEPHILAFFFVGNTTKNNFFFFSPTTQQLFFFPLTQTNF